MVRVNTSAVQAMSKWFMVWSKTEVAVAGNDRTQKNLNNPHLMGLLSRTLKKKIIVTQVKLTKTVLKMEYIYGCKLYIS